MKVQVVSFNCILKDKMGKTISTTYHKDVITKIGSDDIQLYALASALQKIKKGEKKVVCVNSNEAYGPYDPSKVILFPKNKLPKNTKVGDIVVITNKNLSLTTYKVLQLYHDWANLDSNHPLAGQDLEFHIEALDIRPATTDEVSGDMKSICPLVFH